MRPRVTVLLPVYNGEDLVGPALDSVLAQTYDDFELLVVDDCSRDNSVEVVSSYEDPRVRLVRNEENVGQVASLNRGLREARGEYVARLDQDDACLPRRLERQVAVLDAEPDVAIVGTWVDLYDAEGRLVRRMRGSIEDQADFLSLILTNQLPLAHPSVMFRLAPVLEAGGYDVSLRYAEDQDLWRRLALAGHEARVVRETLLRFRLHEGQQSQRHAEEQQANNMRSLDSFVAALTDAGAAPRLRLLLTWNDGFWDHCRDGEAARRLAAELERLLERAVTRLSLDAAQAAKLDRLVRARVALAARRSWRHGVILHWRVGLPLLRFGLRGLASRPRAEATAAAAFVYAAAPALAVLRRIERITMAVLGRA